MSQDLGSTRHRRGSRRARPWLGRLGLSGLFGLLGAIAACGSSADGEDIVGPFTGITHRFVVDRVELALDVAAAQALADDLDGNGMAENQLGVITGLLAGIGDLSIHGGDMIASGALASTVELVADDPTDDDAVGLRYLGADGDAAVEVGGALVAGAFRSNRTATTRAPGRAVVRLPVFTNADPMPLVVEGLEVDLTPDGSGGYDAVLRGGIRQDAARAAAYAGLRQMFATEPWRHLVFERAVDLDRDGTMSDAELDVSVIAQLVTADIQLFDGATYAPRATHATPDSLSMAVRVHLAPCATGRCTAAPPVETCRDRVRDGDETDVDCGGSCQPCADALTCAAPSDCQSRACPAGACAAATCGDGVQDGFESDVDCGLACAACATGRACADDADCASGTCTGGSCVAASS